MVLVQPQVIFSSPYLSLCYIFLPTVASTLLAVRKCCCGFLVDIYFIFQIILGFIWCSGSVDLATMEVSLYQYLVLD